MPVTGTQVSRSFAAVIRQLPSELAVDILIFYLVLRALDTIEDDMDAFKGHPNHTLTPRPARARKPRCPT